MPKALTIRLPWMLSWRRFVRVPVVTCPRLVNRLIFLVSRKIGKIDAGKTIEAITAKTQSFRKTTTIKTIREQVTTGTLTNLLQESIQGNRIVKAFGMEQYESERFTGENQKLFKQSIRASRMRSVVQPAMELLASFGIGGVVWYGGFLFL